jgi:hypothetical protein
MDCFAMLGNRYHRCNQEDLRQYVHVQPISSTRFRPTSLTHTTTTAQRADIEAKMAKKRSLTPSQRQQLEREDKHRREKLRKVRSEDRFGTIRF